jgi:hypothetical protein
MRSRVSALRRWLACLVAVGSLGCGGDGAQPGTETGPCYPNATCNAGLTCLSERCVRVEVDGGGASGGGGGGAAGATGSAGVAGGRGGAGGASGIAGSVGFQPAPHPRLPQVANLGGPVLASPRVQPVLYAADSDAAGIASFLATLETASYWREATSEYGVGPLQILPAVTISTPPPATIGDGAIESEILANTTGASPAWGAGDPSTVYLVVLPQGTLATFADGETCCRDFGGYHSTVDSGTVAVPYAVGCSCPGAFGPALTGLQERTFAVSHELVEAATDPFPTTNPAYYGNDYADFVWSYATGGELGDMCAFNADAAYRLPGTELVVQRTWSNAAAGAARNPCVPVASSIPYFNSFPALQLIQYPTGSSTFPTQGLSVALGSTVTIDVSLFSAGPIGRPWSVTAYTFEDLLGGSPSNLSVSLDKSQGANGDHLHLTVTPHQANPYLGGEAFILVSQYAQPGDADFQSNMSMALIRN